MKNLRYLSWNSRAFPAKSAVYGFLIISLFLLISTSAACGEAYSLQVSKKPLKNVLDELSALSGITFIYDDDWGDFPITVQFKNIELEPALKRILTNLNHAVIFNPDGSITIRIYEVVNRQRNSEVETENVPSLAEEAPGHQLDEPQLTEEKPEETDDASDDEQLSEETEETEKAAEEESEAEVETEESSRNEETPADAAEAP